jgi:hypothetical protein
VTATGLTAAAPRPSTRLPFGWLRGYRRESHADRLRIEPTLDAALDHARAERSARL